ncbi:protein FAM70B-like isoform 2 [Cricetulus griseus]|uniref:Protein FAM70B-like isoform 2 n=1 Tax=Cricetulus griseus TaxID=10029 RepID=A0A061IR21_CRIGR|nr:protein FAM70B-like isoform 2 [Cricetulus griseus]
MASRTVNDVFSIMIMLVILWVGISPPQPPRCLRHHEPLKGYQDCEGRCEDHMIPKGWAWTTAGNQLTNIPLILLTEGFARRKKISLWFVGSLLLVSTLILTIGLAATTRTENVTVGGYYPGIILVAAIVFISFGVVAAFCCAIVDGVFAARHIVTCYSLSGRCQLKVRSNTCYCCDLYACGSTEPSPAYYEFVGVRSCQDVIHLYRLLWVSTVLNVLGLCLGIVTAAVLGAFKDMVPLSQLAYGPSPPPQILYNPAQQILAYTGLCSPSMTVPTCSSYPLPLQHSSALPASSSADLSRPEDTESPSQCNSSHGRSPNAPSVCTPTYFLPGEKPPPYAP